MKSLFRFFFHKSRLEGSFEACEYAYVANGYLWLSWSLIEIMIRWPFKFDFSEYPFDGIPESAAYLDLGKRETEFLYGKVDITALLVELGKNRPYRSDVAVLVE